VNVLYFFAYSFILVRTKGRAMLVNCKMGVRSPMILLAKFKICHVSQEETQTLENCLKDE